MGGGGQMSSVPLQRPPISKPPFTLAELKKAVPPHCFERSLLRSFSYITRDLFIVSIFYYIATTYIRLLPHPVSYIAWPLYWLCQGAILNGLWIIGHDCGHHAFSDYPWIDDTVGLIIHSSLLTPYFSFKYSHRHHHSSTSSVDYDEVFVPKLKLGITLFDKYINNPPGRLTFLIVLLTVGWPFYLLFNAFGRRYDRFASHFNPYSPIFSDRERAQVLISDVALLAVSYSLYRLVVAKGLAWVFCVYGGPLLAANAFLVLTTYLNHTHSSVPHYDSSEWDWMRGALATVDRDYGILDSVFHNAESNHVAHHLFSTVPHYRLEGVTKAIKPILGKYYHFDRTPIYKAAWRAATECIYVAPDEGNKSTKGVLWYNNKL